LATTNTVNVTLGWDTITSCAFDTLANLRITAYDTTGSGQWKNLGNGGTTGNASVGTVVTGSASGVYGAYALGTVDSLACLSCNFSYHVTAKDTCIDVIGNETETLILVKQDSNNTSIYLELSSVAYIDSIHVYSNSCAMKNLRHTYHMETPFNVYSIFDTLNTANHYVVKIFGPVTSNQYTICFRGNPPCESDCPPVNPLGVVNGNCISFSAEWSCPNTAFCLPRYHVELKCRSDEFTADANEILYGGDWTMAEGIQEIQYCGLCPGTDYSWRIRWGSNYPYFIPISEWTGSFTFTTPGTAPSSPAINLNSSSGTFICPGESTILSIDATNACGAISYNWSNGMTGNSIEISPATTTTYSVTVVMACGPTITESITIEVGEHEACIASLFELEIAENTVWDTDKFLCGDIVVLSGKQLTISSTVYFNPNAKLTIEAGARLVVDGGTLTTHCPDAVWKGIEVLGTPSQPAPATLVAGGPQGIVELKNGAVIEHAKVGIRAAKETDCCNYSGGVVRASNSTFRNCRKAVELMTYKHPSKSSFTNCTFICDAPMNDPAYVVSGGQRLGANAFVTVWHQRTVRFTGCSFINAITYTENGVSGSFPPDLRGVGIGTVDATILVQNCDYTGLTKGVETLKGSQNSQRLLHYNSEFTNVMQGIRSEGSTFDRISGNDFAVPVSNVISAFGISMYKAQDHVVSGNEMTLHGTTPGNNLGVWNRGGIRTRGLIRNNEFDKLMIGTQTEFDNQFLKIHCNDYHADMQYPWVILGGSLGPQGNGCDAFNPAHKRAGNRFYNAGTTHIFSFIQQFNYYYPNISEYVPGALASWPNRCVGITDEETSCGGGGTHGLSELHGRRMMLDSLIGVLDAERETVANSLDSSLTMTDTLLAHIADTAYSKALLTAELLNWSLLSDTVLVATLQREPALTEPQRTQVLFQNSPLSNKVWGAVKPILATMKPQMADSLVQAQAFDTPRTVGQIDRETAVAKTEWHRTVMDYLEGHLDRDSIMDSTYTAVHYMLSLGDKDFYKLAVGTTLSLDTLTWSRTLLDTMTIADTEDSAFYAWHDLALSLREDSLSWFSLDSTQIVMLRSFVSDSTEMSGYADAVLALLGDSSLTRTPQPLPELPSGKLAGEEIPNASESGLSGDFLVYPNPLTTDFSIRYTLNETAKELHFEVFDVTGRRIRETRILNTRSDTKQIDLSPCGGLYLLRVTADGKQVYTSKLICVE